MKIAVISHSNIHLRQLLFWKEVAQREDCRVQVFAPAKWGRLSASTLSTEFHFNYKTKTYSGSNINDYALQDWEDDAAQFKPDVLYVQAEPYSIQAYDAMVTARSNRWKYAVFTWENMHQGCHLSSSARLLRAAVLQNSDLVIAGNKDAEELLLLDNVPPEKLHRLPQVGVDTDLFRPIDCDKHYPLLFVGRRVPEKGIKYLVKAADALHVPLHVESDAAYHELPAVYNAAKIVVSFPYTVPGVWKEQSGSYSIMEAMSCGIPVVTSRCGAIPEYLGACFEVQIVSEHNYDGLKADLKALLEVLENPRLAPIDTSPLRKYIKENYSNQVVAGKLLKVFSSIV